MNWNAPSMKRKPKRNTGGRELKRQAAAGRDHRENQRAVQRAVHRRGPGDADGVAVEADGKREAQIFGADQRPADFHGEHFPESLRRGGERQLSGIAGNVHVAVRGQGEIQRRDARAGRVSLPRDAGRI